MPKKNSAPPQTDAQTEVKRPSAFDLLPRLAISMALGEIGMSEIERAGSLCLVVRVPDRTWISPTSRCLKGMADFSHWLSASEKPRRWDDDTLSYLTRTLSDGGKIFGVSMDPETMLPPLMLEATDIRIDIPFATGRMISSLVNEVIGEQIEVADEDVDQLTFEQIVSSIRPGWSASTCLGRLRRVATPTAPAVPSRDVVPVEDLAGYGEAKVWAQNLVADLEAWRCGEADFSTLESRIVLTGPPGTGKTTFAKSVAYSARIPLVETSAASWFLKSNGYLDGVIKQIDAVFASARSQAPAMLFIDELDGVPNRATLSSRGRDWWTPVVNHLLTLLDGASDANRDLVIVGATNYLDRLDEALIRPGRLSRQIAIERPSLEDRASILRQHLGEDLRVSDIRAFANLLPIATGADIAEIVKRARATARRSKETFNDSHLMSVIAPPELRPAKLVERIAIHEAGHAIIGYKMQTGQVLAVSLLQQDDAGGASYFDFQEEAPTLSSIEARVIQMLGGRAAEKVLLESIGSGSGGSSKSDLARATSLIAMLHGSLGLGDTLAFKGEWDDIPTTLRLDAKLTLAVEIHLQRLHKRAEALISEHASLVRRVADALIRDRHLSGAEFTRLLAESETPNAQ